jgi:hypothetical protein
MTRSYAQQSQFGNAKYTSRQPSLLRLEFPINKVDDLRLFKDFASEFLEFVMSRVIVDVVIPVLRAFKFHNKCVRHAILHIGRFFHRRTILGKTGHTWSPSGELSVPPDADLIYGFLEVG